MQFWGKKKEVKESAAEPDAVKQDALKAFADSLFEGHISKSKLSMERAAVRIKGDEEALSAAFEDFEKSDAKPSTEYWFEERNATMQKGNYLSALRNAMHKGLSLQGSDYDSYLSFAKNSDEVINQVMQANFKFKKVMYAYASSLGGVRKRFSDLERDAKDLRSLLDQGKEGYEKHQELLSLISRLSDVSAKIVQARLDLASPSTAAVDDSEISALAEGAKNAGSDVEAVNAELALLGNELSSYLAPLSRAARKYDHVAHNKVLLEEIISNPSASIKTKADYSQFLQMLDSLEKMLNEGSIENVGKATSALAAARSAHIYELIERVHAIEEKRQHMMAKHKEAASLHASASEKKRAAQAMVEAKEETERRMEEMDAEKKELSAKICRLFEIGYGKRISIV